jgi:hypothetical protein
MLSSDDDLGCSGVISEGATSGALLVSAGVRARGAGTGGGGATVGMKPSSGEAITGRSASAQPRAEQEHGEDDCVTGD